MDLYGHATNKLAEEETATKATIAIPRSSQIDLILHFLPLNIRKTSIYAFIIVNQNICIPYNLL